MVVFFYGGNWDSGAKAMYRFVGAALAARGVLTVIPDYRLYPQVRFPAFMDDAAAAVAWTLANIRRFGGDPHRLFLMGHSAGAQIATLLALDPVYLQAQDVAPDTVCGVIGLAGPYDFLPLHDPELETIFGPEAERPRSQPINYVTPQAPPMLLLAGRTTPPSIPAIRCGLPRSCAKLGSGCGQSCIRRIGHATLIGAFAWPAGLFGARTPGHRRLRSGTRTMWQLIVGVTLGLALAMAFAWLVQRRAGNAGWVDVIWSFALGIAGLVYALFPLQAGMPTRQQWLIAAAAGIWSLRLGLHIAARTIGAPEDTRYANFRKEWGGDFQRRMFWFLQIQAAAAALLAVSMLLAARNPPAAVAA